jgi:hypothetical protein
VKGNMGQKLMMPKKWKEDEKNKKGLNKLKNPWLIKAP